LQKERKKKKKKTFFDLKALFFKCNSKHAPSVFVRGIKKYWETRARTGKSENRETEKLGNQFWLKKIKNWGSWFRSQFWHPVITG
jgi:hypothetical protein